MPRHAGPVRTLFGFEHVDRRLHLPPAAHERAADPLSRQLRLGLLLGEADVQPPGDFSSQILFKSLNFKISTSNMYLSFQGILLGFIVESNANLNF